MDGYKFNILHEAVATEDQFSDQTHEKTAQNLYEIISSSEKGVTIGLEGGWGSGKSTVVNFLKAKLLAGEEKTLFYLFDAWAHDGDPLRRIFLEELIESVDSDHSNDTLNELKQEISGRKKTVVVKTNKSTSKLGGLLSFSAIFVPVGAAMLSAVDYSSVAFPSTNLEPHYPFLIGLVLALFPLVVLAIWRISGEVDTKKNKSFWFGQKRWDVFESNSEESVTQDITEDGERTSVEFERFFRKIMDESVGEGKQFQKALIVVDNLDRIEREQAAAVWSVLQTFFQHRSSSCNSDWLSRLWFLVPHDKDGISKIWSAGSPSVGLGESNNVGYDKTTSSFLEKCFQLVEEVPEPVMTSWAEYCEKYVHESLVGWPQEEQVTVIETFKRFESRLESSPTPRQIQSFINRVGVLGMRWGGSVPAEAIALYALLRRKYSDKTLRKKLLDHNLPDSYQGNLAESKLRAFLAGMLFGVDREKGMQLLLKPVISSALRDGDAKAFAEVIEKQGEGFWIVWQAVKDNCLPASNHTEDYRINTTRAFCVAMKPYLNRVTVDIEHLVSVWIKPERDWEVDRESYSESISSLIDVLSSKRRSGFLAWLQMRVERELEMVVASVGEKEFKPDKVPEIARLLRLLESHDISIQPDRYSTLNEEKWVQWQRHLRHYKVSLAEVLPTESTILALINQVDPINAGGEILGVLAQTVKIDPENSEWKQLVLKIRKWANNPEHALGLNDVYVLLLELYISTTRENRESIKSILQNPNFVSRAQQEQVNGVPGLLALCAVVFKGELLSVSLPDRIKDFWKSEYEESICKPIFDVLESAGHLDVLWLLAVDRENSLAISAIRSGEFVSLYESVYGACYIDDFLWAKESTLNNLVARLIEHGSFESALEDFREDPVFYRKCLEIFFRYGDTNARNVITSVVFELTTEHWKGVLKQDLSLFNCLNEKSSHEFKDAFLEIAQEEIQSCKFESPIWNNLTKIAPKLMDESDVALKLAKTYLGLQDDPFNDVHFKEVSAFISKVIPEVDSKSLVDQVESWIKQEKYTRIDWLLDLNLDIRDKPTESLVSRVQSLAVDSGPGIHKMAVRLARLFNIKLHNKDEPGE